MPELPEVETIRTQLSKKLVGLVLQSIDFQDEKVARFLNKQLLQKILRQKILAVKRRAKVFFLEIKGDYLLAFHLKMTGQVILKGQLSEHLPNKHTRAILQFFKNTTLYFQDLRKFGWLKILPVKDWEKRLFKYKLGPEPFKKDFSLAYLKKILQKSSRPIKVLLLDQAKIAGIGNIYANEALFLARINPQKRANRLTNNEAENLYKQIKFVLQKGIDLGGASDNNYLDAYGAKGKFQEHFLVYRRQGKPCLNCQLIIKRISLGGRGTYYCEKCQRL